MKHNTENKEIPFKVALGASGEKLMKYCETAEFLQLPEKTLQYLVSTRQVPHFKLGRAVRFSKHRLLEWLREKEVTP